MNEYKSMKVGDLINTYHSGFFKLVEIIDRGKVSPLFKYVREYDSRGNKKKSPIKQCDAHWCKPAAARLNKLKLMIENYE